MCHYCHTLRHNPQAPSHKSVHCRDKMNSYSKVPANKRLFENGKHIRASNSDETCVICLDLPRKVAFTPCGHVVACESCSSKLHDCPMCREKIVNKQKLFFS